jgi:hypothetical protein
LKESSLQLLTPLLPSDAWSTAESPAIELNVYRLLSFDLQVIAAAAAADAVAARQRSRRSSGSAARSAEN